jgi:ATPase subunit of ABC transporter with duplicated ATPase domains
MNKKASDNVTALGIQVLKNADVFVQRNWYWIGIGALVGFTILFNILFTFSLMYLNPTGKRQAIISEEESEETSRESKEMLIRKNINRSDSITSPEAAHGVAAKRGMVLPFTALAMSFDNVNYYVDMPAEMKAQGAADKLQLLRGVTGAFRPGILTALMGVSGAGKTTLMDVLAGRKTGGYVEGDIKISGFAKKQETFARISGYCEQTDIHSPQVTVKESLIYSAFLRLQKEVSKEQKNDFCRRSDGVSRIRQSERRNRGASRRHRIVDGAEEEANDSCGASR